jgi:hypothetical protein
VKFLSVCRATSVLLIATVPMSVSAQLSDHRGKQLASHGLGKSHPMGSNVSLNANWQLYVFERDGMLYYQVNDLAGRVHIIIGRAGDAFWALPAGDVPFRASVPSRRLPLPEDAGVALIYRHSDFSILRYGVGEEAVWSVERH